MLEYVCIPCKIPSNALTCCNMKGNKYVFIIILYCKTCISCALIFAILNASVIVE